MPLGQNSWSHLHKVKEARTWPSLLSLENPPTQCSLTSLPPPPPSQPSTLRLSPSGFSHWPLASMWSQSPPSSSGFTKASASIAQAS